MAPRSASGVLFVALVVALLTPGCFFSCVMGGCFNQDRVGPWMAEGLYESIPPPGPFGDFQVRHATFSSAVAWSGGGLPLNLSFGSASVTPGGAYLDWRFTVRDEGGFTISGMPLSGEPYGRVGFGRAVRQVSEMTWAQEEAAFNEYVANATASWDPSRPDLDPPFASLPNLDRLERTRDELLGNQTGRPPSPSPYGFQEVAVGNATMMLRFTLEAKSVSAEWPKAEATLDLRADGYATFRHYATTPEPPSEATVLLRLNQTLDALGYAGRPPPDVPWARVR